MRKMGALVGDEAWRKDGTHQDWDEELSVKGNAAVLFAKGRAMTHIAEVCGISRTALYNWAQDDTEFLGYLAALRVEHIIRVRDKGDRLIERVIDDDGEKMSDRLKAVDLGHRRAQHFENRLDRTGIGKHEMKVDELAAPEDAAAVLAKAYEEMGMEQPSLPPGTTVVDVEVEDE